MNTLRAILMLDQSGAKLTDEFGNASGVSLELLFGSAVRLELDLRSAMPDSDGKLASYPASSLSGAERFYFALNDTFQSSDVPKYLQFENVGAGTVQGRTIFHAEIPALNSETLSSALAGKASAAFFCECGGVNDETPPAVVFCFQFPLVIRNRIYPGAGSAIIAGDPAYYTALETNAVVSGAVNGVNGRVATLENWRSAVSADVASISELSGEVDAHSGQIEDLEAYCPGEEILSSAHISARHARVYRKTLSGGERFILTAPDYYMPCTFELHLTQPASAVSFIWGTTIWWDDGSGNFSSVNQPPTMTDASTTYCLVFRYDGSHWLGNLAYKVA